MSLSSMPSKRHRLYVSCGEGLVDVFERRGRGYQPYRPGTDGLGREDIGLPGRGGSAPRGAALFGPRAGRRLGVPPGAMGRAARRAIAAALLALLATMMSGSNAPTLGEIRTRADPREPVSASRRHRRAA